MPDSEMASEAKNKRPTGSSKRKRKQSIKRKIVLEENSDYNDAEKSSKVEKPHGKRAKADKVKSSKEADEVKLNKEADEVKSNKEADEVKLSKDADEVNSNNKVVENVSCSIHPNLDEDHPEDESNSSKTCKFEETRKNRKKIKNLSSDSSNNPCNSSKQQCQNCKFCAEHTQLKQEPEEVKDRQMRTKKKFPCEICANEGIRKVYKTIEKHKHHMATVHEIYNNEKKRFECTECPEKVRFSTKSKLTYHLGTKHPGIVKFVCEICTETFKLKTNYKTHLKSHNIVVEKKFSCNVCNGTFVNKAGYEAHKRRFPGFHIKQSCSHCGFSFSREKHLKNHRCKKLLLEEAAARANLAQQSQESTSSVEEVDPLQLPTSAAMKTQPEDPQLHANKKSTETLTNRDVSHKKITNDEDSQANKRVVFHRLIPRRNQDQTVYRPVQMQSQGVPESVVFQEFREIDFEGGTFIAASADPEQQFIVRDINGHLVQGNQILQLDINDVQTGEESQIYLADWNIVAPYVVREKSP